MNVSVDSLFFIGSQLVALSHTGKVGVWHSMTQHWQVGYERKRWMNFASLHAVAVHDQVKFLSLLNVLFTLLTQ